MYNFTIYVKEWKVMMRSPVSKSDSIFGVTKYLSFRYCAQGFNTVETDNLAGVDDKKDPQYATNT